MPDDAALRYSPPVEGLAATTGEEWRYNAGFGKRLKRLSAATARSRVISKHIRGHPIRHAGLQSVAERMAGCASQVVFRFYPVASESRISQVLSCGVHLLCSFCAVARASKACRVYAEKWDFLKRGDSSLKAWMVTFTVRDGPDLVERLDHLQHGLKVLRQRSHRRNAATEWSKAVAAVWSVEVVRGKGSGEWHPHAHCIWICREEPDAVALAHQWHSITGDSFIVDVRPISEDASSGFVEVFKYAVKLSELEVDEQIGAYTALGGRRLIASSGLFYGLKVEPGAVEEMLPDPVFTDLLFQYQCDRGYTFAGEYQGDDAMPGGGGGQPPRSSRRSLQKP